jgi:putative nucleotidyltransferase with HDIG domain
LRILNEENAKIIGLDIIFLGRERDVADDQELVNILKQLTGKVVLAYFLDSSASPVYPNKEFKENSITGFINAPSDPDGILRRLRAYVSHKEFSDMAWSLKVASAIFKSPLQAKGSYIRINDREIPVNKQGNISINYLYKPKDFKQISFYDLINNNFPKGIFKDKIVLIGSTSAIFHDIAATPLADMPGIFIQANMILDILKNRFLKVTPLAVFLLIFLFSIIILDAILSYFTFLRSFFLCFGLFLALLWLNIAFKFFGYHFDYGLVVVSLFYYLIFYYFWLYLRFLTVVLKIKSLMTLDPVTNLYNLRYFFERLNLDLKSISYHKKYLVVINLEKFDFLAKEKDFENFKDTWHKVNSYLYTVSNFWSRYDHEIIIGVTKGLRDFKKIKSDLERILLDNGIAATVKVGVFKITADLSVPALLPALADKLRKNNQDIVFFTRDNLAANIFIKPHAENLFSSLYLDAEEKNRELVMTIKQLREEESKNREAYLQLVSALVAALESKDSYTRGHTQRVCNYVMLLVDKLKLPEDEREKIRKAALLHDIGKIGIPDNILHKHAKLNDEEFAIIREHENFGARILEPIKEFQGIIPYILHHHENYDGNGYPHGLCAESIPLGARIIAVGDVYDALTTDRDYKDAFSIADAVAELRVLKGKKLDPVLVDLFIEALKEAHIFHGS